MLFNVLAKREKYVKKYSQGEHGSIINLEEISAVRSMFSIDMAVEEILEELRIIVVAVIEKRTSRTVERSVNLQTNSTFLKKCKKCALYLKKFNFVFVS